MFLTATIDLPGTTSSTRSTIKNGKRCGRRSRMPSMPRGFLSVIGFFQRFSGGSYFRDGAFGLDQAVRERVELAEAGSVLPPQTGFLRGQVARIGARLVDRARDDAAEGEHDVVADRQRVDHDDAAADHTALADLRAAR